MATRRPLPWLLWLLSGTACSAVGGGVYGLGDGGAGGDAGRRDGSSDARADVAPRDGAGDDVAAGADVVAADADGGATKPDGGVSAGDAGATDDGGSSGGDGGGTAGCGPREVCGNGIDDDCNGRADDSCACVPGAMQRCYGGSPTNAGRGACAFGSSRCEGTGEFGQWSACEGWGRPAAAEVCGNATDDDCDGMIDEGCACAPGETRACYSGPTDTRGVGACRPGTQTCVAGATGADWGPCLGEVTPRTDRCDGMDLDCDGAANTGCVCVVGTMRACYSGPDASLNVGVCRPGIETCMHDDTTGQTGWGACVGEVIPATDRCDGMDRDCDGNPNTGCACTVGATRACYEGPAGTQDVGACRAGTQSCTTASGAAGWGACAGEVRPATEVCGNGVDDNCNNMIDEGCVTCAAPRRMCPSGCVDVLTDPANCGACGNVCPAGNACANGVCVGNGQLRITMVWSLAGDMDLHVVPPCGTEIYYANTAACSGALDRDDIPGTGPENIFWNAAPPSGAYLVCAVPYGTHGVTNFTVTVTRGTTEIRRWTGTRTSAVGNASCSRSSPYFVGEFSI